MSHPSPKTPKERAADREKHSANTFFRRAILDSNNIAGRFAKEEAASIVGAGAKYPAASGPWSDPTARLAMNGPDPVGYDQTSAPVVGSSAEIEEAALRKELNRLSYEQKVLDPSHPDVQTLQERIDECRAKLRL